MMRVVYRQIQLTLSNSEIIEDIETQLLSLEELQNMFTNRVSERYKFPIFVIKFKCKGMKECENV